MAPPMKSETESRVKVATIAELDVLPRRTSHSQSPPFLKL